MSLELIREELIALMDKVYKGQPGTYEPTPFDYAITKETVDKVKRLYPIMYEEEADEVGDFIKRGWKPPEEAKVQKATPDRTNLHEWSSPKGLPEGWRGRALKGLKEER